MADHGLLVLDEHVFPCVMPPLYNVSSTVRSTYVAPNGFLTFEEERQPVHVEASIQVSEQQIRAWWRRGRTLNVFLLLPNLKVVIAPNMELVNRLDHGLHGSTLRFEGVAADEGVLVEAEQELRQAAWDEARWDGAGWAP